MAEFNSSKSPYHGLWIALLILMVFPIVMSFIFYLVIDKWQFRETDTLNIWTGIFFGYLCGSAYLTITIICGLYKGSFKNMILRVVHFIKNWKTSFKLAWILYKDEVREQGLVFWVIFPFMSYIYGVTIYSLLKVLALID